MSANVGNRLIPLSHGGGHRFDPCTTHQTAKASPHPVRSRDEWADADTTGFEDGKATVEGITAIRQELQHGGGQCGPGGHRIADQYHPGTLPCSREYKLAEILVFRKQQTSFRPRDGDHLVVICAGHHLRDRSNVVSSSAQGQHHRKIAALIGHKAHGTEKSLVSSAEHNLLVCQRIRGVTERSMDVFPRELRISLQKRLLVGTFSDLPEDQLNRDP